MSTLRIIHANILTPKGRKALHGKAMNELHHIPDGEITIVDGTIDYVGPVRENVDITAIDAQGRVVLPGFVASHTRLVFRGFGPEEFMLRLRGDSYMSIMERGGGIVNTMKSTREASTEQLVEKTRHFIDIMSRMGVTTVEAKSGYGLDREAELKQLRVMAEIIREMLPEVKKQNLAENCDIFCERGVFTVEQSRRLLKAAADMGYGIKIHADEIVTTGGAELSAELNALSADHLLHASDEGIKAMAHSDVVATLLPLTAFTLREPYARGREMIDAGCAVALATDLNPGSCCSGSIPLTFALACIYMNFSVEEAITALTLNGAAAIGRAEYIGSLEPGKLGDLVMLDSDTHYTLPYYTGMNSVIMTVKRGRIVSYNNN